MPIQSEKITVSQLIHFYSIKFYVFIRLVAFMNTRLSIAAYQITPKFSGLKQHHFIISTILWIS